MADLEIKIFLNEIKKKKLCCKVISYKKRKSVLIIVESMSIEDMNIY